MSAFLVAPLLLVALACTQLLSLQPSALYLASHSNPSTFVASPARQSTKTAIVKNVGSNLVPKASAPKRYPPIITSAYVGIPSFFFNTAVEGISFSAKFNLPADTYDIELGFVQVADCKENMRIFHIYFNGYKREESLDVFKLAACNKALVLRYNNQIVDPIATDGLEIAFEAVSGLATWSYLRIRNSNRPCVPEVPLASSTAIAEDHYAHAVPGTYPAGGEPSYVDRRGDGFYTVKIDGSGSHTHFAFNGYTAKIKSYTWTIEASGKVISTKSKFLYKFPLGTTVIKLKVTDSVCSEHEESTSITVTGRIQRGAICYMYQDNGVDLSGNTLNGSRRPISSFVSKTLKINFPPASFKNKPFAARCIFLVKFKSSEEVKISLTTGATGPAHLYRGPDRIFDSSSAGTDTTVSVSKGFEAFEITYRYTVLKRPPVIVMRVNGGIPWAISYDSSTTLPIISSISPASGSAAGGTDVRITGYNLYRPLSVFFGSAKAAIKGGPQKSTEVTVVTPPKAGTAAVVGVKVQTGHSYVSNEVQFSYGDSCDDVKFDTKMLQDRSGKKTVVNQPTAVTMGYSGELYVGTIGGQLHVINYDHDTAIVQSMCHSEVFKDSRWKNDKGELAPRTFFGIALDPRVTEPRPYVSASTLLYFRRNIPISTSNKKAWSNGAIERFKPSSAAVRSKDPKQCLEHDKNIVDGLPVANGDHVVSDIMFTQSGDLLIAMGAHTNMGLPNVKLGGMWEAYFSGSFVIARLSKPGFNGKIPYTTPFNYRTAKPKTGYKDVGLYATGVRNAFAMTMSRRGIMYAGDNGPNLGFGDAATNCSEYVESEAAIGPYMRNVAGGGGVFENGQFSANRPDKLLWVKEGKFYGQPNLQRSALLGVNECSYIDVLTGRTPPPGKKMPPGNYERRLAVLESPTTGLIEYGGNEFCGKVRGTLITSKPKKQGTFAIKMKPNGLPNGAQYQFNNVGGLRVVEDSTGSLIFPKLFADPTDGFFVLKPRVTVRSGIHISGAVPYRHGKKGGNKLQIGGRGFTDSTTVSVGGKTCMIVSWSSTKIVCRVPPHGGGSLSVSVVVKDGAQSASLTNAVLYMEV